MQKPVALVLLTSAGFAGGLGVGLWIGVNHAPPPPPPAWVFSEFKNVTKPGASLTSLVQARPDLWRPIKAELEALNPQIASFREQIEAIDTDFRREFELVLTDVQKRTLDEAQKKRELPRIASKKAPSTSTSAQQAAPTAAAAGAGSSTPKSQDQAASATAPKPGGAGASNERPPKLFHEAIDGAIASIIFIPYTLERFTQVLSLDERQQVRLRELLLARRSRFVALADEMSPPSLQLIRIAELIRKAEAEAGKR